MRARIMFIAMLGLLFAVPSDGYGQDLTEPPILLSISANSVTRPESRQGWPLLVVADVMHRQMYEEGAPTVTVSMGGSWASAVRLVVTDEQNNPLAWPFHLAYTPAGALTLDAENVGELAWWLTPEETSGFATGSYHIAAYLDSTAVGAPFDGLDPVTCVPVELTLLAQNPAPTDEEEAEERLLFADYYVLKGEDTNALTEVDLLLAQQPTHIVGLTYRAQLLRADGQLVPALNAFAAAAGSFFDANPDAEEPPFQLLSDYYDLMAEIEAQTTFDVTVATKTPLHVYYQQGSADGFLINGIEGGELWLYEDTTYTFRMVGVPAGNPFYFSTSGTGNGSNPYSDGVTGQPATGNSEATLTPSATTPDIIYYQSMNQPNMGWRIHIIRDVATTGVNPSPITIPIEYHLGSAYPNPFNEETRIELTIAKPQRVVVTLYNVRGQEVRKIFDNFVPGQDTQEFVVQAAGLASGWYIIRVRGETFSDARGVILVK